MTRIAQKVYEDGIEEGEQKGEQKGRQEAMQENISIYLESRFGLKSATIENNVKSIVDLDVLSELITKLYKAETENEAIQLIHQALENDR